MAFHRTARDPGRIIFPTVTIYYNTVNGIQIPGALGRPTKWKKYRVVLFVFCFKVTFLFKFVNETLPPTHGCVVFVGNALC